jgi:hypothetical protein
MNAQTRNFFTIFLYCTTITAQIHHGKEYDFMIAAVPSSGSTFLKNIFLLSLPEVKSKNETFNVLFIEDNIKSLIGHQPGYFEYIARELPASYLENFYIKNWLVEEYNITKEVLVPFQIPFFQEKFTITGLYRHRKYTLPTPTKDPIFLAIYESFMGTSYPSESNFHKIQNFLRNYNFTTNF